MVRRTKSHCSALPWGATRYPNADFQWAAVQYTVWVPPPTKSNRLSRPDVSYFSDTCRATLNLCWRYFSAPDWKSMIVHAAEGDTFPVHAVGDKTRPLDWTKCWWVLNVSWTWHQQQPLGAIDIFPLPLPPILAIRIPLERLLELKVYVCVSVCVYVWFCTQSQQESSIACLPIRHVN